jgi:hypothetical protein
MVLAEEAVFELNFFNFKFDTTDLNFNLIFTYKYISILNFIFCGIDFSISSKNNNCLPIRKINKLILKSIKFNLLIYFHIY